MAGQQRHVPPPVQLLDDVVDEAAVVGDGALGADALPDLLVLLGLDRQDSIL